MANAHSGSARLRGNVVLQEALGSEVMVHLTVEAPPAMTDEILELQKDGGEDLSTTGGGAARGGETTVVGRFSPRSRVRLGEQIEAAVNAANLHFFDPDTGLGIYGNHVGDNA